MVLPATNRRDFLKTGLIGLGSVMMLPSCLKNYTPWQFFTGDEAACMVAICEQIIPADAHGPGATYAGVIFYIDKQLDGVFTHDQKDYRKGLAALQQSALEIHGNKFETLEFDLQTSFLQMMEKNRLPGDQWNDLVTQSALFSKMIDHTMQGFYGSPRHGGNRHYISYQLMKLDYPYIVGQNRYRDLQRK